jgi:hypothetical protein
MEQPPQHAIRPLLRAPPLAPFAVVLILWHGIFGDLEVHDGEEELFLEYNLVGCREEDFGEDKGKKRKETRFVFRIKGETCAMQGCAVTHPPPPPQSEVEVKKETHLSPRNEALGRLLVRREVHDDAVKGNDISLARFVVKDYGRRSRHEKRAHAHRLHAPLLLLALKKTPPPRASKKGARQKTEKCTRRRART